MHVKGQRSTAICSWLHFPQHRKLLESKWLGALEKGNMQRANAWWYLNGHVWQWHLTTEIHKNDSHLKDVSRKAHGDKSEQTVRWSKHQLIIYLIPMPYFDIFWYTLWHTLAHVYITNWKDPPCLMGKLPISTGPFSMAICVTVITKFIYCYFNPQFDHNQMARWEFIVDS